MRLYIELLRFALVCIVFVLIPSILLRLFLPVPMDDYQRSYILKRSLLEWKSRVGVPSVVLLGGSNVAFGFDSGILSDSLGRPVINMGINQQLGLKFMLDQVSHYLCSGDVLLLCPEYENFFGDAPYGRGYLEPYYWYDPLVRKDFSLDQYRTAILSGLTNLPCIRLQVLVGADHERITKFNDHGDHIGHWSRAGLGIDTPDISKFSEINHTFLDYYSARVRKLRSMGVEVLILPPSYACSAYAMVSDRISAVRKELSVRDIDYMLPPDEFVYADSLFYDTHYHLGYAGVLSRTSRVLSYLRPFVIP
jgi:hypothetical protein